MVRLRTFRRHSPRLATAGLVALLAAGCAAGPTPYTPAGAGGYGYDQQLLEDRRYRVSFTGNASTSRETVENYLLYRAAEITRQTGGDYFVVVEKDVERIVNYVSTTSGLAGHPAFYDPWYDPWPYYGPFGHRRHSLSRFGTFGGLGVTHTDPVDRYRAYAVILVRDGREPPDDPTAYDAEEVLSQLAPMVARNSPQP